MTASRLVSDHVEHLVGYQREVAKGKFYRRSEFLKANLSGVSPSAEQSGLTLETSAFRNSLRRLIYPYQLPVDN